MRRVLNKSRRWLMGLPLIVLIAAAVATAAEPEPASPGEAPPAWRDKKFEADPLTQVGQEKLEGGLGRKHTPSPAIFPEQSIPLRFSHEIHVDGEGMGCLECHDMVENSVRSADVNLPLEATCFNCHDVTDEEADPPAACSTCHPGYVEDFPEGVSRDETSQVKVHPPKVVIPEPHLKFNHKVHLAKEVPCATCHKNIDKVALATRENALPIMETCIDCHDGKDAPDECRTCHITQPDGRIDVHAGEIPLAPAGWYKQDAHDADWLYHHRAAAQADQGYCEQCHTPKECVDCHNGVRKPLKVHPNNWILMHAAQARRNQPDCNSCHRVQSFCLDCHMQTKVVSASVNVERANSNLKFHPDGWINAPRSENHHSYQAQRNIRACASCHTEATCLQCHSTFGGLQVNPHPPGFLADDCDRMLNRNPRVCAKCHTRPQCRPGG